MLFNKLEGKSLNALKIHSAWGTLDYAGPVKINCHHKRIYLFILHLLIGAFIIINQNQLGEARRKSCLQRALSLSIVSLLSVDYHHGIKAKTCIYDHEKQTG